MTQLNVLGLLPPFPAPFVRLCLQGLLLQSRGALPHPASCHSVTGRQEGQHRGWQWLIPTPITASLDAGCYRQPLHITNESLKTRNPDETRVDIIVTENK